MVASCPVADVEICALEFSEGMEWDGMGSSVSSSKLYIHNLPFYHDLPIALSTGCDIQVDD